MSFLYLTSRFCPAVVRNIQHISCRQLTLCTRPLAREIKSRLLPVSKRELTRSSGMGGGIINPSSVTWCVYRCYAKKVKNKSKKDKGKAKINLSLDEVEEVINLPEIKKEMASILEQLKSDYVHQLSLRISTNTFQTIPVETDDGKFPLNQLGQVIQKNPSLIIINLSMSPQYLTAVKDALSNSGVGINPQIDSNSIFLPIPKVTREQREKLSKSAKTLCDKSKQKMRDVNNKYSKKLKSAKQDHSEDLIHSIHDLLLSLMHENMDVADEMMKKKQQDLLSGK